MPLCHTDIYQKISSMTGKSQISIRILPKAEILECLVLYNRQYLQLTPSIYYNACNPICLVVGYNSLLPVAPSRSSSVYIDILQLQLATHAFYAITSVWTYFLETHPYHLDLFTSSTVSTSSIHSHACNSVDKNLSVSLTAKIHLITLISVLLECCIIE